MAYVPDPTDATQPIGSVKAGTADEEFRALKAYIQGLVLGAVSQGPTDRQTVLSGSEDSSGDPNFLSAGVGLSLNLAALSAPLNLTYAAGSGAAGDINYSEAVGADAVGVVSGLAPSNLSYITKLYGGAWGAQLSPPQYGKAFDKTGQLLVRWPGANNAVATTEDFGNTFTFSGNAKLSTAVQILGLNTLALDGTGDFVDTPWNSMGGESWEVFGSFRTASLAAAQTLFALCIAATGTTGMLLRITAAGRPEFFATSNNTAFDIAAGTLGASTIVINTTYYYRMQYDAVAGSYKLFLSNNGAAETLEFTVVSALRLANITQFRIGAQFDGGLSFNGNMGYTGIRKFASFTGAQAIGPTVAPTFADVKRDFYDLGKQQMFEVTAASAVSGTNPTLTAIRKLYVAEATTSAVAVTAVDNYAYRGKYESALTTWNVAAASSATHRLGVVPKIKACNLVCVTQDGEYVPGDEVDFNTVFLAANTKFDTISASRRTVQATCPNASQVIPNKTTVAALTMTPARWKVRFNVARGW